MKPWHILLFGLVFFAALGLLGYFFPEKGIYIIPELQLRFPHPGTFLAKKTPRPDIRQIIAAADISDSTSMLTDLPSPSDTVFRIEGAPKTVQPAERRDSALSLITNIQMNDPKALQAIFDALYKLRHGSGDMIRILHYGDSQIEGDRITDVFRQKLQSEFGGKGTGLSSLMPLTSTPTEKIEVTGAWDRYNTGLASDKRVMHENFGVMAGFCRFSAYKKLYDTSKAITASIKITVSKKANSNARSYSRLRLYYGGAKRKTWCEYYNGPALMAADSLEAWGTMKFRDFKVSEGANTHVFKFRGKDSPDFYGVSLEGNTGVMVDNIPLRGSSGTFFHHISQAQLRQFYDHLNVKLFILQFGGNTLPAIKSDTMAKNYASYIRGQIGILKKVVPGASILFIGPADMDIKDGLEYVTHPYLESVRNELKKTVLAAGCAYYDLYDIMGGANSMAAWVEEKLAAPDYIHFSPQGARKVSALLHAAFIEKYHDYIRKKELR